MGPAPIHMNVIPRDWQERLAPGSFDRELALSELRRFLLAGVRSGLSGRPRADKGLVEDVVQVAMVRILDHLASFQGRSSFTTWALSIALRTAFTELRRRHWNHVSLEELKERGGTPPHEVDTSLDPHQSVERSNLITTMHHLIRTRLTARQRDVLLAALGAMPQDEIALQMNITRNALYKLFHDARKALRRALEDSGYGLEEVRSVLVAGQGETSWD
jgi:RNA polymerase sigma-70 factor, ECF subfamily